MLRLDGRKFSFHNCCESNVAINSEDYGFNNTQIFAGGWDAKRLLEENRAYKNDVRLRGLGVDFNPRRRVLLL
jgi:hypothetical protein